MKSTSFDFRFRFLILVLIFALGFWAPWNIWLHLDSVRAWQAMAAFLFRRHWMSFSAATDAVLIVGIVLALIAAVLRTWAAAYLGASVVQDGSMHGETMVADGPYRYLRNPLYVGLFFFTLALALLMPPSGAGLAVVLVAVFQLRLIVEEESFLAAKIGAPYTAYKTAVPSVLASLTPLVAGSGTRGSWLMAVLSEIGIWGTVASFAVLGWRYNAVLILQGVLVSFGLSIIVRAFLPKAAQ